MELLLRTNFDIPKPPASGAFDRKYISFHFIYIYFDSLCNFFFSMKRQKIFLSRKQILITYYF